MTVFLDPGVKVTGVTEVTVVKVTNVKVTGVKAWTSLKSWEPETSLYCFRG